MTFPIYEVEIGQCMTPGCKAQAGYGIFPNFCQPCADNLARIRAEFAEEAGMRCISFKNGRKTYQRPPVCCNPYCNAPRRPPAAFCDTCAEQGYAEEECGLNNHTSADTATVRP